MEKPDLLITGIVIAKNEEQMIEDCWKSLDWVDEKILIDNVSTDKTKVISRNYGAKVFKYIGGSFDEWRNFGAKKANGQWLLYVDADERVTPLLASEIKRVVINTDYSGFDIPRRNIQLGHEMKYGGWPDAVRRLIRKDKLISWTNILHEQPNIEGSIGRLKESLTHITHRSVREMIAKTNVYSEKEAHLMLDANHPPMNIVRFITAMLREFRYRFLTKQGWRDGYVGFIEIFYQMFSRLVSYAKLWELQNKSVDK